MKLKSFTAASLSTVVVCLATASFVQAENEKATPDQSGQAPQQQQQDQGQQEKIAEPAGAQTPGQSSSTSSSESAQHFGAATEIKSEMPKDINKISHLIGSSVRSQQGERLGNIKDVVIDLESGRVAYVVLQKSGAIGIPMGKMIAVPLGAFSASSDGQAIELNADKTKLDTAQTFSSDSWPNLKVPQDQVAFWGVTVTEPAGAGVDKSPSTEQPQAQPQQSAPQNEEQKEQKQKLDQPDQDQKTDQK